VVDDDGVSVTIPAKPARIITFAPSNTEIVFALGLGAELVGVSGSFDNYPPQAASIEQVGGSGEFGVDPNAEKVLALRPDLMLTIAGGDTWKSKLRDLGVPVFTINATDLADLLDDIRTVGMITGADAQAQALAEEMTAEEGAIETAVSGEPPVPCFFEVFYPPLTSIGPHTFIFDLLRRAGCDPVTAGASSDYPEWSVDELVSDGPAFYLVASESGVSAKAVGKRPGFSAIEAVAQGHVFLVDSDLISRPGPRVIDGLRSLAGILHPGSVP
jgi:iron complex transport system substrate-binding protein